MPDPGSAVKVLVYSDDRTIREQVRLSLGSRPAPELPAVEIVECATLPVVTRTMDTGTIDLAILDGEASSAGGMGVCRELKAEIHNCPPVLVLIARDQDAWLASWSQADTTVTMPLDPVTFPEVVAALLRRRLGALPAR